MAVHRACKNTPFIEPQVCWIKVFSIPLKPWDNLTQDNSMTSLEIIADLWKQLDIFTSWVFVYWCSGNEKMEDAKMTHQRVFTAWHTWENEHAVFTRNCTTHNRLIDSLFYSIGHFVWHFRAATDLLKRFFVSKYLRRMRKCCEAIAIKTDIGPISCCHH